MYFCSRKRNAVANIEPSGTSAEQDQEKEYSVEKVLNKRKRNNKIEYFIKWKCYDDKYNTWEPEENLDCADLINEFEETERKKKEKVSDTIPPRKIPEKIIGATECNGQLEFLTKWIGIEEAEFVPAKEANLKWPQMVIEFYEGFLSYDSDS